MCDVTREDFEELYPAIKDSIENAAFIAIDSEFTGLSTSTLYEPSLFDTPAIRYDKLKRSLSHFTMCQCGVSAFVPDKTAANKYNAHTYNFFVFPHSFGPIDSRFSCQASAMEFLTNHNFDFNMFLKHGISYMNKDQENIVWKYHSKNTIQQNISSFVIRQLDEYYINPELLKLDAFVKSHLKDDVYEINAIPAGIAQYLLLKSIEKRFADISCIVKNGKITVYRQLHADGKISFYNQYEKIINDAVGFSLVMQMIAETKKPIVGHNVLADLILIYGKFFHTLPDTYLQFKREVNRLFPNLYDTKHVAFSLKKEFNKVDFFEVTSLEELFKVFSSSAGLFYKLYTPHITHAEGFTKYETTKTPHEAGYDAYMTGYVFLRLAHLAASRSISSTDSHPLEIHEHLAAIQSSINCVNIARAAVRYLNFGGDDPEIVLPECFIVILKDKRKMISATQVAHDFLPFGSVDVKLRSGTQALVAVSHRRRARDVVKAFSRNKFYAVVKYNWWLHSPEANTFYCYSCVGMTAVLFVGTVYFFYKTFEGRKD